MILTTSEEKKSINSSRMPDCLFFFLLRTLILDDLILETRYTRNTVPLLSIYRSVCMLVNKYSPFPSLASLERVDRRTEPRHTDNVRSLNVWVARSTIVPLAFYVDNWLLLYRRYILNRCNSISNILCLFSFYKKIVQCENYNITRIRMTVYSA